MAAFSRPLIVAAVAAVGVAALVWMRRRNRPAPAPPVAPVDEPVSFPGLSDSWRIAPSFAMAPRFAVHPLDGPCECTVIVDDLVAAGVVGGAEGFVERYLAAAPFLPDGELSLTTQPPVGLFTHAATKGGCSVLLHVDVDTRVAVAVVGPEGDSIAEVARAVVLNSAVVLSRGKGVREVGFPDHGCTVSVPVAWQLEGGAFATPEGTVLAVPPVESGALSVDRLREAWAGAVSTDLGVVAVQPLPEDAPRGAAYTNRDLGVHFRLPADAEVCDLRVAATCGVLCSTAAGTLRLERFADAPGAWFRDGKDDKEEFLHGVAMHLAPRDTHVAESHFAGRSCVVFDETSDDVRCRTFVVPMPRQEALVVRWEAEAARFDRSAVELGHVLDTFYFLGGKTMVAPPSFKATRFARVLVVTWFIYAAYNFARRPFSVGRAQIQADTGLTKVDTSLVDTAFLVMYALGQMAYGSIVARLGLSSRVLLVAGLGASAATVALSGMASGLTLLVLASGINGLVQAVGWASCMVIVSPWLGAAERGMVMGLWGTCMAAGGVIGNTVSAALIQHTQSWRSAMIIDAGVVAAVALGALATLGQHPNGYGLLAPAQEEAGVTADMIRGAPRSIDGVALLDDPQQPQGRPAVASPTAEPFSSRQVMAVPGMLGIALSYFFGKLVRYVLIFWLPYYFNKRFDLVTAGVLASTLDVGGLAGSVISGWLSDRIGNGRRRVHVTTLMIAALTACLSGFSIAPAWATTSPWVMGTVGCACGVFTFGIDSLMTSSLLQDYAERQDVSHHLGPISAFVGGVGTVGSILQGPMTVAMSSLSWEFLFGSLQVMSVLSAALLLTPWRIEREQNKASRVHSHA